MKSGGGYGRESDRTEMKERSIVKAWFWSAFATRALLTVFVTVRRVRLRPSFILTGYEGSWFHAWQLAHATFWSCFIAWTFFGLNKIAIWVLVALAMGEMNRPRRVSRIDNAYLARRSGL
jgi:hypothetical protein